MNEASICRRGSLPPAQSAQGALDDVAQLCVGSLLDLDATQEILNFWDFGKKALFTRFARRRIFSPP